jgi:nucleoside-diphosphate-sugar epimerase
MKILVTGADGFVGSHLSHELDAHGHTVIRIDKPEGDLAEPWIAEHFVGAIEPDYVVHLAARYGRLLCADEPHRAVTDNAAATTEIAAACAERGIPVLYTSSSEVYGDHGEDTITEESELRTPTTIYGLSKLWGEEALNLYLPSEKVCTVRMNMLYGPAQRADYGCCALAQFIKKGLQGEPFTVHRNASRTWLYISDAVKALRLLIEGGHSGVYNLGNEGERRTMNELAVLLRTYGDFGHSLDYDIEDAPASQIRHKNYSSAKLRATIDWEPEVSLAEGIPPTVEAQKEALCQASVTRS